jgi:hypothetical protein
MLLASGLQCTTAALAIEELKPSFESSRRMCASLRQLQDEAVSAFSVNNMHGSLSPQLLKCVYFTQWATSMRVTLCKDVNVLKLHSSPHTAAVLAVIDWCWIHVCTFNN